MELDIAMGGDVVSSLGRTVVTRWQVGSALASACEVSWVRGLPGGWGKAGQAEHMFSGVWNCPASLSAFGSVTCVFVFSEDWLFLFVLI